LVRQLQKASCVEVSSGLLVCNLQDVCQLKFDKNIDESISNHGLIKHTFQKTNYNRPASTISFRAAIPVSKKEMFCRQCGQTKDRVAFTTLRICGKLPETEAIQDTLIEVINSVAICA